MASGATTLCFAASSKSSAAWRWFARRAFRPARACRARRERLAVVNGVEPMYTASTSDDAARSSTEENPRSPPCACVKASARWASREQVPIKTARGFGLSTSNRLLVIMLVPMVRCESWRPLVWLGLVGVSLDKSRVDVKCTRVCRAGCQLVAALVERVVHGP